MTRRQTARYLGQDFDGGHWHADGTRSWREFAPPSREPHPPTKPRILSTCRRRGKPRDTCRRASLREDLATAVYGPGVLLGMLLLSDVIRHPGRWRWVMRPAVAALGALPIPERSECDRMPV